MNARRVNRTDALISAFQGLDEPRQVVTNRLQATADGPLVQDDNPGRNRKHNECLQAEDEPRPTRDAPVQQQDPDTQRSDVPPDHGSQEADLAIEPRQTIPRAVQHRCIKRQGLWFSC